MQEWYTLQELADMWKLTYAKVRAVAAALAMTKAIITREKPEDRRTLQVHRDSIALVRQGATGIAAD